MIMVDTSAHSLTIKNISKCYHLYDKPYKRFFNALFPSFYTKGWEFWALRDINFTLRAGQTLGIIGKNGAGKSTLLQILCGTLSPTSGNIHLRGRVAALLELGAGFNEEFTGRENVYLNAAIYGLNKKQVDQRLDTILQFADIGDFIDQPVKTYSSGMVVRLAFAIVAHVDADVLVIDEALAVGDALFAQKCMRFLENFKEQGSIIFVSHNSGAVLQLCDTVIWLEKGSIRQQGRPRDVMEKYLESMYLEKQGADSDIQATSQTAVDDSNAVVGTSDEWEDQRQAWLEKTDLRNTLELYRFTRDNKNFGTGLADIEDVYFLSPSGKKSHSLVGGTRVRLCILLAVRQSMERVIIGFLIKNRLGQVLFGENNLLFGEGEKVNQGQSYRAQYEFFMPYLVPDDYVITVGVASGTSQEHIQHQWIHDALQFSVHTSHVVHGLFGVPVTGFSLLPEPAKEQISHEQ